MEGPSLPDYERRFIGPEQLCALKTRRFLRHAYEHAMREWDLCTRAPEE